MLKTFQNKAVIIFVAIANDLEKVIFFCFISHRKSLVNCIDGENALIITAEREIENNENSKMLLSSLVNKCALHDV